MFRCLRSFGGAYARKGELASGSGEKPQLAVEFVELVELLGVSAASELRSSMRGRRSSS